MKLRRFMKNILHADIRLPAFMGSAIRMLYRLGIVIRELVGGLYATIIVKPVMQSIATGCRRLRIERIPYIRGEGRFQVGDDVYISGLLGVTFLKRDKGQTIDHRPKTEDIEKEEENSTLPTLRIGNRSFIGHQCSFALSSKIEIGDDCLIAGGTKMQDNDGHPLDAVARKSREKVPVDSIKPITIGNNVWIAPRCTILKGVTIGDNAVVATGSVVTKDVPANTLVAGVPAKVVREL